MNNIFFELIRVSIGTQDSLSRVPSSDEWVKLYDTAKKQSLVGICFAGLHKLDADAKDGVAKFGMMKKQYLTWMGYAAKIQMKNELVNKQCVKLQTKLAKDGFRSCILKGQANTPYYGELGALRQSGDIDLYVDCGREKILEYLRSLGMNKLDWDYVHVHAPFFDDTPVEVHYRAGAVRNIWKNKRLQRFWKQYDNDFFEGHAMLPTGDIVCPSARMHLLYLIHHAYRHMISGGIGLRQVMDMYFALISRNSANDNWLTEQVKYLGMEDFVEAVIYVMHEAFALEIKDLPWKMNEVGGRFLFEEIMKSGNFGVFDKRFGNGHSKFAALSKISRRSFYLARYYTSDALSAPFYYVWHFCWKRLQKD